MSENTREPRLVIDKDEVAAKIQEFTALELSDSTAFAEVLADNIMEPDPVETAAFRDDELAFKSYAATRYLIENTKSVLARRRRGSEQQRRTEAFIHNIGRERRILENIVNGIRAKNGMLPNAPNPRRRAERRLVNENMAGDVPQGRIRELIIEEQEIDKAKKRQAKKARQAERRSRK